MLSFSSFSDKKIIALSVGVLILVLILAISLMFINTQQQPTANKQEKNQQESILKCTNEKCIRDAIKSCTKAEGTIEMKDLMSKMSIKVLGKEDDYCKVLYKITESEIDDINNLEMTCLVPKSEESFSLEYCYGDLKDYLINYE